MKNKIKMKMKTMMKMMNVPMKNQMKAPMTNQAQNPNNEISIKLFKIKQSENKMKNKT